MPTPTPEPVLHAWRQEMATRLLVVLVALAVPILAFFAPSLIGSGSWFPLLWGGLSATLVLAAWARRKAPLAVRGGVAVFSFLSAGAVPLLSGGDVGVGVLHLLGAVVLATVLLTARAAVVSLALGLGVVLLAAWSSDRGLVLMPLGLPPPSRAEVLVGDAVTLVSIGAVMVACVNFLLLRLRTALEEQGDAVARLEVESSQRQQALDQLRATQARLVEAGKMELLGQLAAGLAHDMNNALTVVLAEASLLQDTAPEASDSISDSIQHASKLTRQLLAMGRRDVVQPAPLELGPLVERTARLAQRTVPADIAVQLAVRPGVVVNADPNQVQQVVLNLVTNARDAMPAGGTIRIAVEAEGAQARLVVADSGTGIEEALQAKIFEPFFTSKARGVGTGLGLASVKDIVERLGGEVGCRSRPGEGATFTVTLPRLEAEGVLAQARAEHTGGRQLLEGRRILVAEDDRRVRALVCSMLEHAGAVVVDAADGRAAIALAEQDPVPFDLVWTDVVMPRGGGGTLIAWFTAHRPEVKVVVCTGYADDEVLRRDVALGRHRLVNKPFTRDQAVLACVEALRQTPERPREPRPRLASEAPS